LRPARNSPWLASAVLAVERQHCGDAELAMALKLLEAFRIDRYM
jgi:hypothetical protein